MAFTVDFLLEQLEQQGLFNIVLPFLLIFAIVYGLLQKLRIFGDNEKINAIIAFVLGMYITVFSAFASFLADMASGGAVILVGLLFFMMIVGFGSSISGGNPASALSKHKDALTIILMLVGGILFVNSGGLLVVGAYELRITLSDIFGLTFLYLIYVFIKNLIGGGKPDFSKVRKLMERYNDLQKDLNSVTEDDDYSNGRRKDIKNQMEDIGARMTKMGVKNPESLLSNGSFDMNQPFPIYGRYGNRKEKAYRLVEG